MCDLGLAWIAVLAPGVVSIGVLVATLGLSGGRGSGDDHGDGRDGERG